MAYEDLPAKHAPSHATGGNDLLAPADIGAATAIAVTQETTRANGAESSLNTTLLSRAPIDSPHLIGVPLGPDGTALLTQQAASGMYAASTTVTAEQTRAQIVEMEFAPLTAMFPWYAVVGKRATTPLDVLFIGDSITEGQGVTTLADRYTAKTIVALRKALGSVAGGDGYVAGYMKQNTIGTGLWTYTGAPTQNATYGLGRRSMNLVAGTAMSRTFVGTGLLLFYYRLTSASFSYSIDGGAATTVASGTAGEQTVSVTGLAAGSHTVTVSQVSGAPIIEGAFFYNGDETSGVRHWDGSKFGTYTSQFTPAPPNWMDPLVTINPAVIVSAWMTNDVSVYDAPTYQTQTQTLITNLRTKSPNSLIVLLIPYPKTTVGLSSWADYVAASRAVASANANVVVCNIGQRVPTVSPDTYGLMYDAVHGNAGMYQLMADSLGKFLLPR